MLRAEAPNGHGHPWCGLYSTLMLNPTPPQKLCDEKGRPYFLWDVDMTLETFQSRLSDPNPDVRAHAVGKLLRQARPDDALTLVSLTQIRRDWDRVLRHLGKRRAFWSWLMPELERRAA
ncbi:MAG: hypothetical protein HY814_10915 [Candidatus Riflebacteria bacterium]|nr:hypothetical protein [Candidatus Riflebacteria bacterium]